MNRSPNSGVGTTPLQAIAWAQFIKPSTPPFETFLEREVCDGGSEVRMAATVSVGHKPNPISSMRGSKGCSRYTVPLRIKPETGQVSENSAKPSSPFSSKQVCDVLHEDVLRSKLASQTDNLRPQTRAFALHARAKSSNRQVLAGKPSADDVNGNSIGSKSFCGEGSDVIVARDLGPVFRQHAAAEWFDLAERDGLEAACALKAEREAADAAKQVQDAVRSAHHSTPWRACARLLGECGFGARGGCDSLCSSAAKEPASRIRRSRPRSARWKVESVGEHRPSDQRSQRVLCTPPATSAAVGLMPCASHRL